MKRILCIVLLLISFAFMGCKSIINNEIHNESYNVEIDLKEFEDLITASVTKASPSVVGVSNYEKGTIGYNLSSTGSGVIYKCEALLKNGQIESDYTKTFDSNEVSSYIYKVVTNRHVIESNKENKIQIFIGSDNKKVDAKVLGFDDKVDLAVLEFNYPKFISPITFGDSELVKAGNFAIAIGNPLGYEYYSSATFGIVSFPKRTIIDENDSSVVIDYIQHDAYISYGSSGGALVNIKGELIGINTFKVADNDFDRAGFAIPSNLVLEIISYLEKGELPERLTLGITFIEINEMKETSGSGSLPLGISEDLDYGLYVDEVDVYGLAFKKLQHGDIILMINDTKIIRTADYYNALTNANISLGVTLKVLRGGEEIEVLIRK